MLPDIHRTIVALASGPRPARRAIIRMAGPDTSNVLAQLCSQLPANFLASTALTWCDCQCLLPSMHSAIPLTLLYWPNERSYTGGPAAELHLIGSLPLAEAIINRCCQLGAEPAERGEFTLRAFLAGKLDLAQAEAVLGVIEADSQATLQAALSQLGGNLAPAIAPLRSSLVEIVAELEAGLDFVDEDIQFISQSQVIAKLQEVQQQLDQFASRLDTRSSTDRAPHVVLTGLPNSGKSSLFNSVCQQPLAIVADVPGTTRDYLQQRVRWSDIEFDLIDTAGWEEVQGTTPRALAQQQLARCLESADLVVLCVDLKELNDEGPDFVGRVSRPVRPQEPIEVDGLGGPSYADGPGDPSYLSNKRCLLVGTKADLLDANELPDAVAALLDLHERVGAERLLITSQAQPESIVALTETVAEVIGSESQARSDASSRPMAVVHETAVRCRAALSAARASLSAALAMARSNEGEELIAAELRLALDDLSTIIGEVHSDDVLGEIFARFCIGK